MKLQPQLNSMPPSLPRSMLQMARTQPVWFASVVFWDSSNGGFNAPSWPQRATGLALAVALGSACPPATRRAFHTTTWRS
eukprot:scaffold5014_cov387-Prasinococcus_capsulatus_cf.AAC.10